MVAAIGAKKLRTKS